MAVQNLERIFTPTPGRDLFSEVQKELRPYVARFSLSEQADPKAGKLRVWRTGFEGKLVVEGNKVQMTLDYAWLIPSAVCQKITEGVKTALYKLPDGGPPGKEGSDPA
jgi:hypothetical protein